MKKKQPFSILILEIKIRMLTRKKVETKRVRSAYLDGFDSYADTEYMIGITLARDKFGGRFGYRCKYC